MSQIPRYSDEGSPHDEGRRRQEGAPGSRGLRLRSSARQAGLIVLAVLPLLAATCQRKEVITSLPEEMHGRWRTKAQSHADAYLDLAPKEIGFGSEGNPVQHYPIFRIEADRTRSEDVPLYTVEYVTNDGNRYFSFWYQERFRVIRLNHRWDMMWRLEGDEGEPPPAAFEGEDEEAGLRRPDALTHRRQADRGAGA